MTDSTNKQEFFSLLDAALQRQHILVSNSDTQIYKFKALTTNQLKQIVQTLIDTSLTNLSFNSTIIDIMKQNYIAEESLTKTINDFNIVDKILFILANRIQTVSDKVYILDDANEPIEIDLTDTINKFIENISNSTLLQETTFTEEGISVIIGLPLASIDLEINQILYKNFDIKNENSETLEALVGKAFVAEIVKWIKQTTIQDTTLIFSELSFDDKFNLLEKLPASLTEKILNFVEDSKQTIQNCLSYSNKVLPLDGSLFTIR